jgi:hypothetical protein
MAASFARILVPELAEHRTPRASASDNGPRSSHPSFADQ